MEARAAPSDFSATADIRNSPTQFGRDLAPRDHALVRVGQELQRAGYHFTTITPLSHRRVIARPTPDTPSFRDIFGWNRPFAPQDLPDDLLAALEEAEAVEAAGRELRSTVRFSTLCGQLFAHSPFPTEQADAVFFGPDTYRFARVIERAVSTMPAKPGTRMLDIGAGSGAGGLHAAHLLAQASCDLLLTDINQSALRFSRINAVINKVSNVRIAESDLYAAVEGSF